MVEKMSLQELFNGVSKKLKIDFEEQAKLLGHPGEVGTGRETVLENILVKYLPRRYGVDSGFVIDALGNKSEQIDIIIYEADYTPVFEIVDGKKFFPCETVVAVGQVRTDIGSRDRSNEPSGRCFRKIILSLSSASSSCAGFLLLTTVSRGILSLNIFDFA
jgi:Domain of unknown function (DUF6602)